jgi:hypothetical protein
MLTMTCNGTVHVVMCTVHTVCVCVYRHTLAHIHNFHLRQPFMYLTTAQVGVYPYVRSYGSSPPSAF